MFPTERIYKMQNLPQFTIYENDIFRKTDRSITKKPSLKPKTAVFHWQKKMHSENEVLRPPVMNVAGDPTKCKGLVDLYCFMNDIGVQKYRDRVPASASISLTK